jgi:sulfide:quinone oxidoreductase
MNAKRNVVIIGGGFGSLTLANQLRRTAARGDTPVTITVIGNLDTVLYQPGFLFVPFNKPGYRDLSQIRWPVNRFLHHDIRFVHDTVIAIDPEHNIVTTKNDERWEYDDLVIALGATLVTDDDEIPGIGTEFERGEHVFGFYTPKDAFKLRDALERFEGGDFVVNVASLPFKCPVAPLEFACLADEYFTRKGIRSRVNITVVTPLTGAFTKPVCNDMLSDVLVGKGISVVPNFELLEIDTGTQTLICPEHTTAHYDMAVIVPPHNGSSVVEDAGLGNGLGFGRCDKHTLRSLQYDNIYFLGDVADVPTSKAGSVAHFQAEVIAVSIIARCRGVKPELESDGHANCFIETGYGKAILVDFNYDVQPAPGKFPLPVIGPMSLLKETHLNHTGKLMFKYVYQMLLRGMPIPLVGSRMSARGKDLSVLEKYA